MNSVHNTNKKNNNADVMLADLLNTLLQQVKNFQLQMNHWTSLSSFDLELLTVEVSNLEAAIQSAVDALLLQTKSKNKQQQQLRSQLEEILEAAVLSLPNTKEFEATKKSLLNQQLNRMHQLLMAASKIVKQDNKKNGLLRRLMPFLQRS